MKKLSGVVCAVLACLAMLGLQPATANAQSQATTGVIEGTVTDPSGGAIAGAEVRVTNKDTGFERSRNSDSSGFYRFILLPLGRYTVAVKMTGFAELLRENVELTVGQTNTVNVTMKVGAVTERVTVTDEPPVVETARTEESTLIDNRSVENLPINGRNFIDFIRLASTVGIVQGPDGAEISINGQRGIYNNVMIDGADANNPFFGEQRGGQRPKYIVSLEAVKEFQVINEGGSAEFGRSAGGFVNMVTKSGTNETHGSLFYFFRGGGLISENFDGTKDRDFRQHQFGGSIGGPIIKDKAFFFFSYDQNEENRFKPRAQLTSPAIGGAPLSPTFCTTITTPGVACGGSVSAASTVLSFLNLRFGDTVDSNASGVPPDLKQTNDAKVLLAKGDFRITPNNLLTTRYTFSDSSQLNGTFDVVSWFTSANGLEEDRSHSFVAQLTSSITTTLLNEFRFQYSKEPRPRAYPYEDSVSGAGITNPFGALPDTAIGGVPSALRFGMPFFLPIPFATDDRYQVQDNFSIVRGRHNIKFGFDYNKTNMTQVFIGFANGRFIFATPEAFINYVQQCITPPCPAAATGGVLLYLQRVPLGGRTIEESGRQSLPVHEVAFFGQDKWQVLSNLSLSFGLRWESQFEPGPLTPPSQTPLAPFFSDPRFPTRTGQIPDETEAWQPRVGLAWDITRDGKTVIRASAGIYYARLASLILAQPRISNGVINTNLFGAGFFNAGALPRYGTLSTALAVNPAFGDLYVFADDYRNPRSWQWSVGAERELVKDFSVGIAFNYANSVHLTRFINRNYPNRIGTAPDGRPLYSQFGTPFALGRLFSVESTSRSLYRAVTFTANKRFSKRWQLQANYVVSWDKSDDDNERDPFFLRYADANNLLPEYSFSDRDQRHRFNLFSTFELPWKFLFSTIFQARSAQPTTGSDQLPNDANGDGEFTDRIFVNGRDVGRNRQRKNNEFFTWDIRVSRPIAITERFRIEPIFEVFNLTNRGNIIQSSGTNLLFNFDGTIRSGLGDPRQAQLGVRFTF